jgi:hypothetical protein
MIVYIVSIGKYLSTEDTEIDAVFANEADAIEYAKSLGCLYNITEWTVQ